MDSGTIGDEREENEWKREREIEQMFSCTCVTLYTSVYHNNNNNQLLLHFVAVRFLDSRVICTGEGGGEVSLPESSRFRSGSAQPDFDGIPPAHTKYRRDDGALVGARQTVRDARDVNLITMAHGEELFLMDSNLDMTPHEDEDLDASADGSKLSPQRLLSARLRRTNPAMCRAFTEVYNSRGKLSDLYRRKAVNALHITESTPEHITQLDFISLIPTELQNDRRIVADLIKRLSEAARHRQRIARANFIYRNEAQRLSEIFRECARREDQCIRLAKLISDVRSERQWKGSMPSVEWFLRRKKGVVSSKAEKKELQAAGPAAPNKLKRLLEISKSSDDDGMQMKVPKSEFDSPDESGSYTEYLKQVFLNPTTTGLSHNEDRHLETKIEPETSDGATTTMESPSGVSTTIISTEELHFPSSSNLDSGLLTNTVTSQTLPNSVDRNTAIEKLETYFSRSTPEQVRQYMFRLRQASNRRLAEEAVDLISTLSSEECSQFLNIDNDNAAGLN